MSRRRWSPSFIVAVTLLVTAVVAYVAYSFWRPNDIAGSEQVVRQFASAVAKEVGGFRRHTRRVLREPAMDATRTAAAIKEIDNLAAEANDRIDDLTEEAGAEIEAMSGISLKTQDNRIDRVEDRAQEGKMAITAAANDAKAKLAPADADE